MKEILFSAKEFADYVDKFDSGIECDAFARDGISDEQHEHLLDVAKQLMDDIDSVLEPYKDSNLHFSSLEELYVTLDLGLADWRMSKNVKAKDRKSIRKMFWQDFLRELVAIKVDNLSFENVFDEPILQCVFSTPNMVKQCIAAGIFDSCIRNNDMTFLEFISQLCDDIDQQYSCLDVLCIAKAWCKRAKKLGIKF